MGSGHLATTTAVLGLVALTLSGGCTSGERRTTQTTTTTTAAATTTPPSGSGPASQACPFRPPGPFLRHQVPGTAARVVPGHPVSLVVCRYHGLDQPQPVDPLARAARISPGPVAADLNSEHAIQLEPLQAADALRSETLLLIFTYTNGARLMVTASTSRCQPVATGGSASLSGCRYSTNGERTIITPTPLLARLETVLGTDPR